jgi:hypothetical protein
MSGLNVEEFEAREQQLLGWASTPMAGHARAPQWVERWREPTGALTLARFDDRVSLSLFGGVLSDPSAAWLEPHLQRMLAGTQQLHFIDQGQLDTPNTNIRNLYMQVLRERRADLGPAHVYIGGNAILRMVTSAANVVLGGLGQFHPDRASFDRALANALVSAR